MPQYIYIFFFLFHEHCSFIFYQPCFLPFLCIYREQNFKHKEWTLNNILISVKPDKPTSVRLSMALSCLQYLFKIGLCRDLLSSAIKKLSLPFTGELIIVTEVCFFKVNLVMFMSKLSKLYSPKVSQYRLS